MNILKMISGALLCLCLLGCAGKQTEYITVYQDVYVPVRCNIAVPAIPEQEEDIVITNYNLMLTLIKTREALIYCTGGIDEK